MKLNRTLGGLTAAVLALSLAACGGSDPTKSSSGSGSSGSSKSIVVGSAALAKAVPSDLKVLDPAPGEDKDSLNVTSDFAQKNGLTSIADLAKVKGLKLAANPEFKTRAYGIPGLE